MGYKQSFYLKNLTEEITYGFSFNRNIAIELYLSRESYKTEKYIKMKLEEIKAHLKTLETIAFQLPNGQFVPSHFHVTEVGKVHKHFIDCGGKVRIEEVINFQLWEADDYDHRIHPEKLIHIIELSEKTLNLKNQEIEVEYQGETIGKYGLEFNGTHFLLTNKQTDCLAKDNCGVPESKPKVQLKELATNQQSSCAPGSGCC